AVDVENDEAHAPRPGERIRGDESHRLLDDFGAEEVVHVERAEQRAALIDDQELADLVRLQQAHRLGGERLRRERARTGRHHLIDSDRGEVDALLESAAVVLAVGARLSGQASCATRASRCTSASRASAELALPVIAISLAPRRFTSGTMSSSSSLAPE